MAGPQSAYKVGCKCQVDKLVRHQLWTTPDISSAEYFKISAKTYQKYFSSSFFNQLYSRHNGSWELRQQTPRRNRVLTFMRYVFHPGWVKYFQKRTGEEMGMRTNMVKHITIQVTLIQAFKEHWWKQTNAVLLAVKTKVCPGDTRPYIRAWKASKRVEDPRQINKYMLGAQVFDNGARMS